MFWKYFCHVKFSVRFSTCIIHSSFHSTPLLYIILSLYIICSLRNDTQVHSSRKILFIRSIQKRYIFQWEIKNIIRITRHFDLLFDDLCLQKLFLIFEKNWTLYLKYLKLYLELYSFYTYQNCNSALFIGLKENSSVFLVLVSRRDCFVLYRLF